MLDDKKMNKFVAIGLIFKYEFKNAAKKLLPLYIVLIILGLILGLMQSPFSDNAKKLNDKRTEIELSNNVDAYTMQMELRNVDLQSSLLVTVLTLIMVIYGSIIVVVTVLTLSKRFKISMMQDEAYLNLVLPVTMGEQIWGRFLSSLCWILICYITIGISYFLYMIRNEALMMISEFIEETEKILSVDSINVSILQFFGIILAEIITISISVLLLFYFVNSMKMLIQKFSTVVGIISGILGIYIILNLPGYVVEITNINQNFKNITSIMIGSNIFLGIIFMAITQIVFSKKLNLE